LEQPTRLRQLALLGACALAFETRAQTVALVIAVLTAPLLLAWIERGRPSRLGAFVPLYGIVGAAAVVTVVVEVARGRPPAAVFASRYSQRIEERNLFYLAPLFMIALLAWIERGQPRPPRAIVAAGVAAAALPGAIPFAQLLNITAESDTVGLQPWWYLGAGAAGVAAVVTALVLGGCFLW